MNHTEGTHIHTRCLGNLKSLPTLKYVINRVAKSRRMRVEGHVATLNIHTKCYYKKPEEEKRPLK
jgi:hypothetical protein